MIHAEARQRSQTPHSPPMSDAYAETLGQMICLLQEYKPGLVTLENITRLCKTLKLESFTDNIDNETIRLSTASKIIVIDMDFHKSDKQVKDVKLVLASNFDNFNYYNDGDNGNILFNSLSCFPNLQTFYYNLRFLTTLDTHSNIETEPGSAAKREKLDLFKYFTELPEYLRAYFKDISIDLDIKTNVDNRFGVYLTHNDKAVAQVGIEECQDHDHRFYEFGYRSSGWINESPDNVTTGVILTLQFYDINMHIPKEAIPHDLLLDWDAQRPYTIVNHCRSTPVSNDFTSTLVPATKFNISNENIELLGELLQWAGWWQQILHPVLQIIKCPAPAPGNETKRRSSSNSTTISAQRRSSVTRRRRSSQKGRRPSMNESSMVKDGVVPEFSLSEVMSQPVLEDEDPSEPVDLALNEEYIQLGPGSRCDIHMGVHEWQEFLTKLKGCVA